MSEEKECTSFQKKLHRRREKVRQLHFECVSAREIARRLNVPLSNIRRDLAYFERQYREALPHEGPHTLAEELDRLCYLEREAWKAWRRSRKPATIETTVYEEGGERTKKRLVKTARSQVGDGHFLELISKSVTRRFQLVHMNQAGKANGEDAFLQFDQICQQKDAITEFLERFRVFGSYEDVYACAFRQDSQPRPLEVSSTPGRVGPGTDGPGEGPPVEIDHPDAAATWEI